jgi:hypothetical protein
MADTIIITTQTGSTLKIKKIENLLQSVINKVDHDDFIMLLQKVQNKPAVVKTALKFIHLA